MAGVVFGRLCCWACCADAPPVRWASTCGTCSGGAGADSLGYYTACAGADAAWVLTNSYTGAIHAWQRQPPAGEAPRTRPPLLPQPCVTGHWRGIVSHCWAIDGECLLTASADQTVRLHARDATQGDRWFEFARPQVRHERLMYARSRMRSFDRGLARTVRVRRRACTCDTTAC